MVIVNGYKLEWLIFALALALIPFLISQYLYRSKRIGQAGIILVVAWVLMFPNIPYLLTKGRYLLGYCGSLSPWDVCAGSWAIGFFFLHSFIGALLMYLSVQYIASAFRRKWHGLNHWHVASVSLMLSALALPIGLFGRFNSWNVFNHPLLVLDSGISFFASNGFLDAVLWYAVFMSVYSLTHLLVRMTRSRIGSGQT